MPFVSKATGVPLAKIAAQVMAGKTLDELGVTRGRCPTHVSVKEASSRSRSSPASTRILGPEMRSTGEVMGIDDDFADRVRQEPDRRRHASCRTAGTAFLSVQDERQGRRGRGRQGLRRARLQLRRHRAARTTFLTRARGSTSSGVNKVREGRPHCVDRILDGEIDLVVNTTAGAQAIQDSFPIRRTALLNGIPYYTTLRRRAPRSAAIAALRAGKIDVRSLQEYQRAGDQTWLTKFPMTPRGAAGAASEELKRLREVERPKNVRDIEEARAPRRSHGERRVPRRQGARRASSRGASRDIESILAQAEVIDPAKLSGSKVVFGATVKLTDTDTGDEVDLHDRRRPRGRHQAGPHRHLGAAGARA